MIASIVPFAVLLPNNFGPSVEDSIEPNYLGSQSEEVRGHPHGKDISRCCAQALSVQRRSDGIVFWRLEDDTAPT
jgi:hypothetical protein